jgi:hypothetical protein
MKYQMIILCSVIALVGTAYAQNNNALNTDLNNIYRLSNAKTRSISPENPTGKKGQGGRATLKNGTAAHAAKNLGQGWKVNPYIHIKAGQTVTLANIDGPGAIKQIWMTPTGKWRKEILRIYWDGEKNPSVEVPIGDFFADGWDEYHKIASLPVAVNPGSGLNSYWVMPFRKHCTITVQNLAKKPMTLYFQITYSLTDVPKDAAYFHAEFRRVKHVPYKHVYTILDDVKGKGQYVGTYLAWGTRHHGWWGEGEVKFYIDGDKKFPTINYTGTEDYFNGSYDFEVSNKNGQKVYRDFTTPYSGFYVVNNQHFPKDIVNRFGMYRWHLNAPIRFDHNLKVTIQDLGWQSGGRYLPLQDDIASVAYWYQTEPHAPFPPLPSKKQLAIHHH